MTSSSLIRHLVSPPRWVKRALVALAIVAIALQWVNTRFTILQLNQSRSNPVVPVAYYVFHSMATGFSSGRIGQIDLAVIEQPDAFKDPWAPYQHLRPGAAHRWVNYYTLDIGYSFIVEIARLAFPSLPDNRLRPLALQLFADAVLLGIVYWLFSEWHIALGLLAAYLYPANGVFYGLVSFAFYSYWDVPLAFIVLGGVFLAYRRPTEARTWLIVTAAALGFAVWLRGSWWPIAFFLLGLVGTTPRLRKHLVVALVVFAIVAMPQVVRSSRARGRLTLSTRQLWHNGLVGLGYYPNPYGLKANDEAVFNLTKAKYGVPYRLEDYQQHDSAAKQEIIAIWKKDPAFVVRSIVGRLRESIAGSTSTSVLSFLFVSNPMYRVLCLMGLIAMIVRGGDRRLLGIAAAGTYVIYVGLTCLFYWVGLAYDNVSQVTLFIMFMGVFDAALYGATRLTRLLRASYMTSRPAEIG